MQRKRSAKSIVSEKKNSFFLKGASISLSTQVHLGRVRLEILQLFVQLVVLVHFVDEPLPFVFPRFRHERGLDSKKRSLDELSVAAMFAVAYPIHGASRPLVLAILNVLCPPNL